MELPISLLTKDNLSSITPSNIYNLLIIEFDETLMIEIEYH